MQRTKKRLISPILVAAIFVAFVAVSTNLVYAKTAPTRVLSTQVKATSVLKPVKTVKSPKVIGKLKAVKKVVSKQPAVTESGLKGVMLLNTECSFLEFNTKHNIPFSGSAIVKDRLGNFVADIRGDRNGDFEVKLAPGKYLVEPLDSFKPPWAPSQRVQVHNKQYTSITIVYTDDTCF